jgi:Glucose-6-phosphate dehydrogenase subunit N-terminal domain/Glucose-6-phosphate dehydrogenase subunit C-terminal domain
MAPHLSPAGVSGGDGSVVPFGISAPPGEPTLRWAGHATSVAEIERELGRIWATPQAVAAREGATERHVAARTSVLNLVVVARSPELGERVAAILAMATGRLPSRTLILVPTDPDGPGWLRADVRAYCMVPRAEAPETCAEQVYIAAGGDTGRHLQAIVAPLLVHDLPVTIWWPGDPPFGSAIATALVGIADRLVVDGSSWTGDGLGRLAALAALARPTLPVSDFALLRQARWREAVASVFDRPEFLPYLRSLRRIAVTYGTHGGANAEASTNLVKPIYHVAWLASRLDLHVVKPLARVGRPPTARTRPAPAGTPPDPGRGLRAVLEWDRGTDVEIVIRPVISGMPGGTTLRVELLAERRGSELRAEVTAEAECVHVRVWQDGVAALERTYHAPRLTDVDLLTMALEAGGRDAIAEGTLAMAARLIGSGAAGGGAPQAG